MKKKEISIIKKMPNAVFGIILMFATGVDIIILGIMNWNNTGRYRATQAKVIRVKENQIVNVNEKYRVYVSYIVEDHPYDGNYYSSFSSVDDSYEIGEIVDIYYNYSDPEVITTKVDHPAKYILVSFGVITIIVSIIFFRSMVVPVTNSKKQSVGVEEGLSTIWCDVINVYVAQITDETMGYVAECALIDGSQTKNIIKCEPVIDDIRRAVGGMAKVAVNSEKGEYYLLTESLTIKNY